MWVTELGIVKFAKDRQSRKASYATLVTESGIVKFAKELQP